MNAGVVRKEAGTGPVPCWRCGRPQDRESGRPCCDGCGAIRRDGPPPAAPRPRLLVERVDVLEQNLAQLAETNQRLEARLRDLAVEWRDVDVRAEAVATAIVEKRMGALSDYCKKRVAELAASLDTEHRNTLRTVLQLTARVGALEDQDR